MSYRHLICAAMLATSLAACQQEPQAPAEVQAAAVKAKPASDPVAVVERMVAHLKAGDVKAMLLSQVPPQKLQKMRAEWREKMTQDLPTEQERQEFEANLRELTAKGAEQKLMEKVEPHLARFETEIQPQLPMWIEIGKSTLMGSVQENKTLNEEQKQQLAKSMDAFAEWAKTTPFHDRARAERAISQACAVARDLGLRSLEEVRAMDFDQALDEASVVFAGFKSILATYGLSLDEALGSVRAEVLTLSPQGDKAKVRVKYEFLKAPLFFDVDLVQVEGQWYSEKAIAELDGHLRAETQPAQISNG